MWHIIPKTHGNVQLQTCDTVVDKGGRIANIFNIEISLSAYRRFYINLSLSLFLYLIFYVFIPSFSLVLIYLNLTASVCLSKGIFLEISYIYQTFFICISLFLLCV